MVELDDVRAGGRVGWRVGGRRVVLELELVGVDLGECQLVAVRISSAGRRRYEIVRGIRRGILFVDGGVVVFGFVGAMCVVVARGAAAGVPAAVTEGPRGPAGGAVGRRNAQEGQLRGRRPALAGVAGDGDKWNGAPPLLGCDSGAFASTRGREIPARPDPRRRHGRSGRGAVRPAEPFSHLHWYEWRETTTTGGSVALVLSCVYCGRPAPR